MNLDIIQVLSSISIPLVLVFIAVIGYQVLMRFIRITEKNREREFELKRIELDAKLKPDSKSESEKPTFTPSGYIILNLKENQKSIFLDLLRGFEEFAELKGYKISFSYDGSLSNRVAFKFTIIEGGISVSEEKVRQDLKEYINKVQKGDSFDDIDIIVPPEHHHMTMMKLKNRLSFLQQTYATQKNALQLYERLIKIFGSPLNTPTTQFYIQGSGSQDAPIYSAVGSQQVAQGRDIQLIDNVANQNMNLGSTFEERKEIIDTLQNIIYKLYNEKDETNEDARETIRQLNRAKEELCDEEKPDPYRVKRYLEKAKQLFSTASFAKETIDSFKDLLAMFNIL